MPPVSRSVEDNGNWPRKLRNMSERKRKRSERSRRENSPGRPREEPDEPGGKTAVPGGVHDVQECPRNVKDKRFDEIDSPHRVIDPGGHLEVQEESEVIEGNPDHAKVVKGA